MPEPFVGEIRIFAGNFAPAGWAFCDGQPLAISENETLFNLIGTTYGGDGQETFNLPNLQSRVPIHMGTGPTGVTYQIGEAAGVESVTLSTQQIPNHTHALIGSLNAADNGNPSGRVYAKSAQVAYMIEADADVNMNASAVGPVGGSQPHENCQPFLCVNFIISLYGVYPSQN